MSEPRTQRSVGELVELLYDRLMEEYGDPELVEVAVSTILTDLLADGTEAASESAAA